MDTTAYLTNQGWQGLGHALHPTGRGIKKPLLVSQKSNVLGIGKKKHDAHADQWWARAFDSSLKGLEVGRNEITGATERVRSGAWGALDMIKAGGEKWAGNGGLYAGFVQGEVLSGTIVRERPATEESDLGSTKETEIQGTVGRLTKKRKSTVVDQRAVGSKAERRWKGKEVPTTTEADSGDREVVQDSDGILKALPGKAERRRRWKVRRSREDRGAAIVQPVSHHNQIDEPRPGERMQRKDGATMLESSSASIATSSLENENGWQDSPAGTLSEQGLERRRKKDRKSKFR
ncbi:hypothetical protein MMC18_009326 [Xylographa bjoerkii]|nr:hypothetical protein [Xylographa bjoerkii]